MEVCPAAGHNTRASVADFSLYSFKSKMGTDFILCSGAADGMNSFNVKPPLTGERRDEILLPLRQENNRC